MPRFAANLTYLFNEHPFAERFRAAAEAGFRAVEYLFPYAYTKDDLAAWKTAAGLEQVLINAPAGKWDEGERGLACLPDRKAEFREGVDRAIDYARMLDCRRVHLVAGKAPAGGPERVPFEDTYRENLAFAADRLAEADIVGLLEPLNGKYDAPSFFLQTTHQARAILRELNRPNLKLQFDAYHVQIMQGDLVRTFRDCLPDIGHMQVANPPERNEPDSGETDYGYFFRAVDQAGYAGWIGCEYKPRAGTRAGLGWGRAFGLRT
ncbi:MAG: TIM barrel protein [Alphaproteobacteria bacterium]|nr:TIM barrel protein [Alphaproteobacteria bacterium]